MQIFTEDNLFSNILNAKILNGEDEPINIFCCFDDGYVNPFINLMYSIRCFCDKKIDVYLLSTSLSKKSQELINEKLKFLEMSVWIKIVELQKYKMINSWWTIDCYLKAFAFEYLPKKLNKVLYLDADMLALNDITELYNEDISNVLVGVVVDSNFMCERNIMHCAQLNIEHEYFNTGTILMNLKQMRKTWTVEFINNRILQGDLNWLDNDLFCVLCSERDYKMLPYKYNYQTWYNLKNYNMVKALKPTIIHYKFADKPWKTRDFNQYGVELFFECAKLTHIPDYCPAEYFEDRLKENIEKSKISSDETINLLGCINSNYVKPTINLLFSIRQYNNNPIDFYVLSTEMSLEAENLLKEKMKEINIKLKIVRYELDKNIINKDVGYWTKDVYLKVFAFNILPKNIEKILYIDADVEAMGDIAELYNKDISNKLIAVRKEPWRYKHHRIIESCKINDINQENYFSAGVILFNLKNIRKTWKTEQIYDLIKNKKFIYPEQDLLNYYCKEKDVLFLEDKYNQYQLTLFSNYNALISLNPILIHYAGEYKPWNSSDEQMTYKKRTFFWSAKLTGIKEYVEKAKKLGI